MVRTRLVASATVAGVAVLVARRLRRSSSASETVPRWLAVTIDRTPDVVQPQGRLPGSLADLGDLVEVETRVAPGGKGTELRARLRTQSPTGIRSVPARLSGEDPRQRVRLALREAKQLIEVGEVLRVNPAPHGHRPPTPPGQLIDLLAKRAPAEGLV